MNLLFAFGVILIFAALGGGLAFASATGEGSGIGPTPQPLGGGMKLSAADIATYARRAGWVGTSLATAIAIALAESSGKPTAYNPETAANTPVGKGSYGLWQVYLKAHPEFEGQNLYDPQTNANAAFSVFRNANYSFTPWSTYNNEAYLDHMDDAVRYA